MDLVQDGHEFLLRKTLRQTFRVGLIEAETMLVEVDFELFVCLVVVVAVAALL